MHDRVRPSALTRAARLRRLAPTVIVVALAVSVVSCGDVEPTAQADSSAETPDGEPTAESVAEQARAYAGIDDVIVHYLDPEGHEHDAPPPDAEEHAGWTARIELVHDIRGGWRWAGEAVQSLVAGLPADPSPAVEIWLSPTAHADVSALAHPAPTDGSTPIREAYLMGATPGVVRAIFDGRSADVQVADESDLAKVAGVAAAHGVRVDTVRTADGKGSLDVAAVPTRPVHVVPETWPDDPDAPDCSAEALSPAIAGHDAATGNRVMFVAATNTGDEPCAVQGYPNLTFRTIDERALDVTVTTGKPPLVTDPGAERVVIPVGARVLAVAGWKAMPTAEYPEGSGNRPDVAAEFLLATGSGMPAHELPLTSFTLTPEELAEADTDLSWWDPLTTLDIVDGGEVTVTAWAPEGTQF